MLVSEALIERKQLIGSLANLQAKVAVSGVIDPDSDVPTSFVKAWELLIATFDKIQNLNVLINVTNNNTVVLGKSVMEQIANRESLKIRISAISTLVQTLKGRNRSRYSADSPKVQLAEGVYLQSLQGLADDYSKELRELDIAMQASNWSTQLIGV